MEWATGMKAGECQSWAREHLLPSFMVQHRSNRLHDTAQAFDTSRPTDACKFSDHFTKLKAGAARAHFSL